MNRARRLRQSGCDRLPATWMDQIFQLFQAGDMERLALAARRVVVVSGLSNKDIAWCRFVFELIATSGICGPDYMDEILNIKFQDLDTIADGFILLPRAGGEYPVFLQSSAVLAGESVRMHFSRGRGQGRNRIGGFPKEGYLVPCREGDETRPLSQLDRRTAWGTFREWLSRVASEVDLRITPDQLAALSRALIMQTGSVPSKACLMGVHRINPVPAKQLPDLAGFRETFTIYRPVRLGSGCRSSGRPRWVKGHQDAGPSREEKKLELELLLRRLRQLSKCYQEARQGEARQAVKDVISRIQDLRRKTSMALNISTDRQKEEFFLRIRKVGWRWDEVDPLNAWMMVEWVHHLVSNRTPFNTLVARINDIATLVRERPGVLLSNISSEDLLDLFDEHGLSEKSCERMTSTVFAFYRFVSQWLPVPKLFWGSFQFRLPIHVQPVLTQPVLERMLHWLLSTDNKTAALGLLLGYFFGLRVSECVNLTLGDIYLEDAPTVFIWRSKRAKNRVVEGYQIPGLVLRFMREYLNARLDSVEADRSMPLLADQDGRRASAWMLNRSYQRAIIALGVDSAGRQSISHLLRHSCANRWWVLGMPLVEIAHRLGHASVDTTLETYLHLSPFFQQEDISGLRLSEVQFSPGELAFITGLTRKRVSQVMKSCGIKGPADYYSTKKILGYWNVASG